MKKYTITLEEDPSSEDIRVLYLNLHEYNVSRTGLQGQLISVFLRDNEHQLVGGAHGWTGLNWLHIDVLWIKEDARRKGYGKQLLLATEAEAVKRGCRYGQLDTFSFQARGFYEKLGYRVFGELDDVAGKHKWYFLKKVLC